MAVEIKPFERIRERVGMVRERIRGQRGQIEIGKGALISKAKEKAQNITKKALELRPGILPKAAEKLKVWYPGKRITEILAKPQLKTTVELTGREAAKPASKPEEIWIHY